MVATYEHWRAATQGQTPEPTGSRFMVAYGKGKNKLKGRARESNVAKSLISIVVLLL